MLPSANPGAGESGLGPLDPMQEMMAGDPAMQAMMQQQMAPQQPAPLSTESRSLVEEVKKELMRRYRDPSFVVPMSIKEPPIVTQMPGLLEGAALPPVAFPAGGFPTNPMAAMGLGGMGGAPGMGMGLESLLGGAGAAPAGLLGGAGTPGMAPEPSRILNPQQGSPFPPGVNPEDVLLI